MHVPSSIDTILRCGGGLSDNIVVRRQQLSRFNAYMNGKRSDAKERRALRNATYKAKLKESAMDPAALEAWRNNPMHYGLPRRFKILTAGTEAHINAQLNEDSSYEDEGNTIFFPSFGVPGKPIRLNNKWIQPDESDLSLDGTCYTLATQDEDGKWVSLYLDFTQYARPTGCVETPHGLYVVRLEPWAPKYTVNVSADAGASWNTAKATLQWNSSSDQWKRAKWEQNSMIFSYDMAQNSIEAWHMEVSFTDTRDEKEFELLTDDWGTTYKALLTVQNEETSLLKVEVLASREIPAPPASRDKDDIKSVFPLNSLFEFDDDTALSFTGAYQIKLGLNKTAVYAVTGQVEEWEVDSSPQSGASSALFRSKIDPVPTPFETGKDVSAEKPLSIQTLLNNNPMSPDGKGGWVDIIAQKADEDFHNIILYYMDSDLHQLFISAAPTVLDSSVKAIATDSPQNSDFYKTLQVPYIVQALGASTLDEGRDCNTVRAQAKLRALPAKSPIYKRQSEALYRMRYLQHFKDVNTYLEDQQKKDWSAEMNLISDKLKDIIKKQSKGVNGSPEILDKALEDVDKLHDWAVQHKLFYAFSMYHNIVIATLPQLNAQIKDGALSSAVARTMKKINALFSVLENGKQNPDGPSFQEAFNQLVRMWQMTSVIPQFVDLDGVQSDFDTIVKSVLEEFWKKNIGSLDPDVQKEAQRAKQLAEQADLRKQMFQSLQTAMRLSGTFSSWNTVYDQLDYLTRNAAWRNRLTDSLAWLETALRIGGVVCLVLPMIESLGGGWNKMSTEQKSAWVITAAALTLTFVVKGIQGAMRVWLFWDQMAGFVFSVKAFFGFGSVLRTLPTASLTSASSFSQWMIRTGAEAWKLNANGGAGLTPMMRIFGRSAGRFLTSCVGALLATVNIVLSIIEAVKSNEPMEKVYNAMMIISSGLQLLAIAASWLSAALVGIAGFGTAVAVLNMAAAILGPLAIVFAVVGLVVLLVYIFTREKPKGPVEKFLIDRAEPEGLKNAYYTSIDDFTVVPAGPGATSLNGISFRDAHIFEPSKSYGYIHVATETDTTNTVFQVDGVENITYLPDTCWCVTTDYLGRTTIYTYATDSKGDQVQLCLTVSDGGKVVAMPPIATSPTPVSKAWTPKMITEYEQAKSTQEWSFEILSEAQKVTRKVDGKNEVFTLQAPFNIRYNSKYLAMVKDGNGKYGLALVDQRPYQYFACSLETMGPSDFRYIQPNWELTVNSTGEENGAIFSGPASIPLRWSITPALPGFLRFGDADTNPGSIVQIEGKKATVMDKKRYTVTAAITITGREFSKTAEFELSVINDEGTTSSVLGAKLRRVEGEAEPATGQDDTTELNDSAPFFLWQQTPRKENMNVHCTATDAILSMQNALPGDFDVSGTYIDTPFESIYFPNPPSAPAFAASGPLDKDTFKKAALAFVSQNIYNNDSSLQSNIHWNETMTVTDDFNAALYSNNVDQYIQWLQWSSTTSKIFQAATLDGYRNRLKSTAWLTKQQSLQKSSQWPNEQIDMFLHFLKMTALGATQEDIQTDYSYITSSGAGHPYLDADGFSNVAPLTWQAYRGYLWETYISYGQVPVQNVGYYEKYAIDVDPTVGPVEVKAYASNYLISYAGFWKSGGGGCCFDGDTRVVMASGEAVPIKDIKIGQKVLSGSGSHRTVRFVSTPRQHGRSLYAYKSMPGVRFTATHPLYQGANDEYGQPILGFVDVVGAVHTNPLWDAFTLQQLPKDELVQHAAESSDGVLFDLVFDAQSSHDEPGSLQTYVVEASSGKRMTVCSEAPDVTALPSISRFMFGFAEAIQSSPHVNESFPRTIREKVRELMSTFNTNRARCAQQATEAESGHPLASTVPQTLDLNSFLELFSESKVHPQILADSIEAVTELLGLSLQAYISDGWQHAPRSVLDESTPPSNSKIITTHFIQLYQEENLNQSTLAKVKNLQRILNKSPKITVDVRAGFSARPHQNQLCHNAKVAHRALGINLHRVMSITTVPVTNTFDDAHASTSLSSSSSSSFLFSPSGSPAYTVCITINDTVTLTASGCFVDDVNARWPLYYHTVAKPDVPSFHSVGWINVTARTVPAENLKVAETWQQVSPAATGGVAPEHKYAHLLGHAVGSALIKDLE